MSDSKSSKNKRFSLLVIAVLMLAAVAGLYLLPSQAKVSAGPQDGFYIIASAADLAEFRDKVNAGSADISAKLTADIDLGGSGTNQWVPIGSGDVDEHNNPIGEPFSGVFDGQGHIISGFCISNDNVFQGLFGYVSGDKAEIRNLTVSGDVKGRDTVGGIAGWTGSGSSIENCAANVSISGTDDIGGIAGDADGSSIANCSMNGRVSGTRYNVGGIAGRPSKNSFIENCTVSGVVSGYYCVGGIAGYAFYISIANCAVSGSVSGTDSQYTGGIAGEAASSPITNCSANGSVSGKTCVGGIAGGVKGSPITNCAANGSVSGSGQYVGGIIGLVEDISSITNCGWLANNADSAVGGIWSGSGVVASTDVVSYDAALSADVAVTCLPETFITSVTNGGSKTVAFVTYPSNTVAASRVMIKNLTVSPDTIAAAAAGGKSVKVTGKAPGSGLLSSDVTLQPTHFSGGLTGVSTDVTLSLASGLTVNPAELAVTPSSKTMNVNDTLVLTASGISATKNIKWTVDDGSVVSISAGTGLSVTVKALKAGTAKVMATAEDGAFAACEITVSSDAPVSPDTPASGGSGGCNTGAFGGPAIAMLAAAALLRRKKM